MEPEQSPKKVLNEKQTNVWSTVTQLSKYLAMLLFVALPFMGGLVGYKLAPEKIVEVNISSEPKTTEEDCVSGWALPCTPETRHGDQDVQQELSRTEQENRWQENYSTFTTVGTHKTEDERYGYLDERDFTFNNSVYEVLFTYGRGVNLDHYNLTDVRNNLSKGAFDVNFGDNIFSLDIHSKGYCPLRFCELEAQEEVQMGEYVWEYLGSSQYCDAGECAKFENMYRYQFGDYVAYINSENPLHISTNSTQEEILNSLRIYLLSE